MGEENVDVYAVVGNWLEAAQPGELRRLLANMLAQLMEADVEALCNAPYASRSDARVNRRNGYRQRQLETRLGSIELAIPKLP